MYGLVKKNTRYSNNQCHFIKTEILEFLTLKCWWSILKSGLWFVAIIYGFSINHKVLFSKGKKLQWNTPCVFKRYRTYISSNAVLHRHWLQQVIKQLISLNTCLTVCFSLCVIYAFFLLFIILGNWQSVYFSWTDNQPSCLPCLDCVWITHLQLAGTCTHNRKHILLQPHLLLCFHMRTWPNRAPIDMCGGEEKRGRLEKTKTTKNSEVACLLWIFSCACFPGKKPVFLKVSQSYMFANFLKPKK